jgi:hypothetical protein
MSQVAFWHTSDSSKPDRSARFAWLARATIYYERSYYAYLSRNF